MAKTLEQRMEELRKEWIADGETDFTDDDLREAIRCFDVYKESNKYTKSSENKPKTERKAPKKVISDEKTELFEWLLNNLPLECCVNSVTSGKKIEFTYKNKEFKLDLVEHRKKKE